MNKPLVSIIIPSYNSKAYLKASIDSALSQTYTNIEVILVDDGSTDGTIQLFQEYENQGVLCCHIENGGASNARNFGLLKAKGDYIQFLDADDILNEFKIEKQLALMQLHQADISYTTWGNFKVSINNIQDQFRFSHIDHNLSRTGKELMISYGMDNWFIPTVSWLVSRDLIKNAGYWNPAKCPNDDGEYFSRVLFWAKQVICCNENLAYYRITPNDSLSKLNSNSKIDASFRSYKQIEALLTTCDDKRLMSYPKRLYFMHYKMIKNSYPKLAKRAAKSFDSIKTDSFLSHKKQYWKLINWFGLYNGTKIYDTLMPVRNLFK